MKTSYLILASLLAQTIYGESTSPLVFFAKVKGKFVPLSGTPFAVNNKEGSLFSYGNSSVAPTEFILQDDHAYTSQTSTSASVGFHEDGFVYGPTVSPISLNFYNKRKIRNGKFYSCKLDKDPVRGILHGNSISGFSNCFEVDIYLLPYNKTTKSAIKAKLPLAFFAKVHDVLDPLSGWVDGKSCNKTSLFYYGNPNVDPAKVTYKNGYAYTTQSPSRGYAGFEDSKFVFGPTIQKVKFKLQGRKKVLNGRFYSCPMKGDMHSISFEAMNVSAEKCFEVVIYLLPYDEETRSAVLDDEDEEDEDEEYEDEEDEDEEEAVMEDDEVSPEESIDSLHSIKESLPCRVMFFGEELRKNFEVFVANYHGNCSIYFEGEYIQKKIEI